MPQLLLSLYIWSISYFLFHNHNLSSLHCVSRELLCASYLYMNTLKHFGRWCLRAISFELLFPSPSSIHQLILFILAIIFPVTHGNRPNQTSSAEYFPKNKDISLLDKASTYFSKKCKATLWNKHVCGFSGLSGFSLRLSAVRHRPAVVIVATHVATRSSTINKCWVKKAWERWQMWDQVWPIRNAGALCFLVKGLWRRVMRKNTSIHV